MSSPSESFEGLPLDVLSLILKHVRNHDFKSLPGLRLASKAMNALVEPMAFGTVTIKFTPDRADSIQDQLSALVSGEGPNGRWTKRLYIEHLLPHTDDQRGYYQFLRPYQDQFLVKAIRSLQGVNWASFDADEGAKGGPYLDVISSLTQLPGLESLSLTFSSEFDGVEHLGLDSFSGLRCIRLIRQPFTKPISDEIRLMIVQSPYLEKLTIESYTWLSVAGGKASEESPADIECLFDSAIQDPNFSSRLSKFKIGNDSTLSSRSVPYFRSLTHLDIGAHTGKIQDGFWKSLSETGVGLHRFKLAFFTPAIIQYLTSYTGLSELEVTCRYHDKEKLSDRVFDLVLPQHESTLRFLSFVEFNSNFWRITEDSLKGVLRCKALRTFALMCQPSNDMFTLLTAINDGLPRLQHLHLRPAKFVQTSGSGYRSDVEQLEKNLKDLHNLKFSTRPYFIIHLPNFGDPNVGSLSFDPATGRFVATRKI